MLDTSDQTSLTENRNLVQTEPTQTQCSASWIQELIKIHTVDVVPDCHKGKSATLLSHHLYTLPPGNNRQRAVSSSNSLDVIDLLFIFL